MICTSRESEPEEVDDDDKGPEQHRIIDTLRFKACWSARGDNGTADMEGLEAGRLREKGTVGGLGAVLKAGSRGLLLEFIDFGARRGRTKVYA